MDFQKFVDSFTAATSVISVEKLPDGKYGAIRIVAGNKPYIDSIEHAGDGPNLLINKFIPNSEYHTYFPTDLNFEDFCYKSAVLKQPQHSYVHPGRFDFWFDLFSLPLDIEDEKLAYCTYTHVVTHKPNTEKMATLSYDTAPDVLSACLKLKETDDFSTAMKELIKRLREICDSMYCCIMLMNDQDRTCHLLGESFSENEDFNTNDDWMEGDFYKVAESWGDLIGGSNCLIIKNAQDWDYVKEKNKAWYDELVFTGVRTMVLFPLKTNGNLLGYIWSTNFTPENAGRIKEILELTSFFISSEISNHLLFDRLKILSTIDSLTGVMNRNEMNNRVDQIAGNPALSDKGVGIVFTDLNGLKKTNDERGHLAGDILLKEAASILKNLFPQDEIYRAGGDEFMILSFATTEEALNKKVTELRKQVELSDTVSFAIGSYFDSNSNNVLSAMTKADKKMYEDKEIYYAEHPEKKRWI